MTGFPNIYFLKFGVACNNVLSDQDTTYQIVKGEISKQSEN